MTRHAVITYRDNTTATVGLEDYDNRTVIDLARNSPLVQSVVITDDVSDYRQNSYIFDQTSMYPNFSVSGTMFMSPEQYRTLRNHSDFFSAPKITNWKERVMSK